MPRHSGGTASARTARIDLQGGKSAPLHMLRACSAVSGRQVLTQLGSGVCIAAAEDTMS
jgi:hypothetical protein